MRVVEKDHCFRARGHDQIAGAPEEPVARHDPLRPAHLREADDTLFHRRDGARHELPGAALPGDGGSPQLRPFRAPPLGDGRRGPALIREADLLPAPRIPTAVERLSRRRRVVAAVAGVPEGLPLAAGVDDRLPLAVPLQQEGRAMAELRDRPFRPPVPDDGRKDVPAGAQLRSQVHGLVAPVHDVRALRPRRHLLAVHEEPIAVVAGDVDGEPLRSGLEVEGTPEVEDAVSVARNVGSRDPAGRGRSAENARPRGLGAGRLPHQECQQRGRERDRSTSHRFSSGHSSLPEDPTTVVVIAA